MTEWMLLFPDDPDIIVQVIKYDSDGSYLADPVIKGLKPLTYTGNNVYGMPVYRMIFSASVTILCVGDYVYLDNVRYEIIKRDLEFKEMDLDDLRLTLPSNFSSGSYKTVFEIVQV